MIFRKIEKYARADSQTMWLCPFSIKYPSNVIELFCEISHSLTLFGKYPSLDAVQKLCSPSFVIAYDSEWYEEKSRCVLSWQFACIYQEELVEFVFLRKNKNYKPSIEWQWNGGHVPSETLGDSFSLYVD